MTRQTKEEPQSRPAAARIRARASADRESAPGIAQAVLRMQQSAGNGAVQRALLQAQAEQAAPVVQPSLVVGAAGDEFEQEADRMASAVADGSASAREPVASAAAPAVQRAAAGDEESLASQPSEEEKEEEGESLGA